MPKNFLLMMVEMVAVIVGLMYNGYEVARPGFSWLGTAVGLVCGFRVGQVYARALLARVLPRDVL